jgi:hypothetical protein
MDNRYALRKLHILRERVRRAARKAIARWIELHARLRRLLGLARGLQMRHVRRSKRVRGPNYAVPCSIIFFLGLIYGAWCSRVTGASAQQPQHPPANSLMADACAPGSIELSDAAQCSASARRTVINSPSARWSANTMLEQLRRSVHGTIQFNQPHDSRDERAE